MDNTQKSFLIILFFLLILIVGNTIIFEVYGSKQFFAGVDAKNHISYSQGDPYYPPLTGKILSFLIQPNKDISFYLVHAIILFLIIPFALFKITRHWYSIMFYFSSYFIWLAENNATIAQTTILLFLILLVLIKNNWVRLGLIVLSVGVHSFGWFLVAVFGLLLFAKEKNFFFLFPCTPANTALSTKEPILLQKEKFFLFKFSLALIFNLFSRIVFLPLWFFVGKRLWQKKDLCFFCLSLIIIFAGFLFDPELLGTRILSMLVFPFSIILSNQYVLENKRGKFVMLFFTFLMSLLNVFSWIERKNVLYCDFVS